MDEGSGEREVGSGATELSNQVVNDREAQRFELAVDGEVAVADYQRVGDAIVFTHTEVPRALRGRGIGSALARGALAQAREAGLEVRSHCEFMSEYLRREASGG